ncbi:HAD-IC family P-type ATPase [uncultured Methanospirillum sp.]|uniref:cation-translocating P-type ATPase n=1 Tax=uncultured Methanospirillum sp. TaxID=262503 RepID=UPI0029C65FA4|nr:HAD-IC family P-type ATPase [uncultured Methanospirillum sp.]
MTPGKCSNQDGIYWHNLPESDVLEKLQVTSTGLTNQEATTRTAEFGKNVLPEGRSISIISIFIAQFKNPLIYVLLVAALVSWFLHHITDTTFIGLVVLINAIIGTVQEWKAEQSAKALQKLFQITATVYRDGREVRIPAEEIVPGDRVTLDSGSRVPADIRLTKVIDCTIDESILTGESVPVSKTTKILPEETPVSDQVNMAFAGTTVVRGIAYGYVTSTGLCTEVGKIATAVAGSETNKPPLIVRMEKFSRHIALMVLVFSFILGFIAIMQGMQIFDVFFFVVALAVSAIPEGLPVALTVVLSIATHRMSQRNVIIRKMTAVESLGSCTLIASDKTGTLTMNEQTAHVLTLPGGEDLAITGTGYTGEGRITTSDGNDLSEKVRDQVQQICLVATLCSEARLSQINGTWEYTGDPIDVAFLALARKAGLDTTDIIQSVDRPLFVPFEAERRYSAAGFFYADGYRFGVKGAAEAVLPSCITMRTKDEDLPVDHISLKNSIEDLAEEGYRVLAVAEAQNREIPYELMPNVLPPLVLLGLVGFIDPIRIDAQEAVKECQKAGVVVVMVTGDHPITALSISKRLNIATDSSQVLTGADIDDIGSFEVPEFYERVKGSRVFARVTPLQKHAIVDALIKVGNYVAVTGDGVNDAPALRRAHIGVAMGSGSDIAKDNAAMIITDDRFSSIVAGIEEGRYAYDNIRKVTYLLVSTGAAEVILFTLALISHLPIPFLAVQLLWLNLVTNGIQHIGLAFEPGEPGAMTRPPRPPDQGIFNRLMIGEVLVSSIIMGLIGFFSWRYLIDQGYDESTARNLALLLFVLLENVHVFNCRSEFVSVFKMPLKRNLFLVFSVIGAQFIHQIAMHTPILQQVLGLQPVGLSDWIMLLAFACLVILGMELFKVIWPIILEKPEPDKLNNE